MMTCLEPRDPKKYNSTLVDARTSWKKGKHKRGEPNAQ